MVKLVGFVGWLLPSGSYVGDNYDDGSKENRHAYESKKQMPHWQEEKK